jgi:hypothetical protein
MNWLATFGRWIVLAVRMPGDVQQTGAKVERCEEAIARLDQRLDDLEGNHLKSLGETIGELREEVVKLSIAVADMHGRTDARLEDCERRIGELEE